MDKWDPNWNAKNCFGGGHPCSSYDNYWAGAKKACDDIGMSLPDTSTLRSIAWKSKAEKEQLGLPTSGYFWTSDEYTVGLVNFVDFSDGYATTYAKKNSDVKVLCVGD